MIVMGGLLNLHHHHHESIATTLFNQLHEFSFTIPIYLKPKPHISCNSWLKLNIHPNIHDLRIKIFVVRLLLLPWFEITFNQMRRLKMVMTINQLRSDHCQGMAIISPHQNTYEIWWRKTHAGWNSMGNEFVGSRIRSVELKVVCEVEMENT